MNISSLWSHTLSHLLRESSQEDFEKTLRTIQLRYAVCFCAVITNLIEDYNFIRLNGATYCGPKPSVSDLKQAFYLALPEFKKNHKTFETPVLNWGWCCFNVLRYGVELYPDHGFQEMQYNFEAWLAENRR